MKQLNPLVSIITVNYNQTEALFDMLESVRSNSYGNTEVIVVDNASGQNPGPAIEKNFPEVKFIREKRNRGFAAGNNTGIRACKGDYIFLLNNDAALTNGAIEKMIGLYATVPKLGAVSPKICYWKDEEGAADILQYAGATRVNRITGRNKILGTGQPDKGQFNEMKPTAYAHGAAVMVSREALNKAGLMDEAFFLYYEELDWCEQIKKAGFEIYYQPEAKVYHRESLTTGAKSPFKTYYLTRNRIRFLRKNSTSIQFLPFIFYLVLIAVPKNLLSYIIKGEWSNSAAFLKGIIWNLLDFFKKENPAKEDRQTRDSCIDSQRVIIKTIH